MTEHELRDAFQQRVELLQACRTALSASESARSVQDPLRDHSQNVLNSPTDHSKAT